MKVKCVCVCISDHSNTRPMSLSISLAFMKLKEKSGKINLIYYFLTKYAKPSYVVIYHFMELFFSGAAAAISSYL